MTYRKIGGLHFLRIGRFYLSWCVARPVKGNHIGKEITT